MEKKKWDKAIKLYKSLKCPKQYFDPTTITLGKMGYHWILSDRSRGKTTNVLLFGLCVYFCYNVRIEYIRQKDKMVSPTELMSLFDTIIHYGYIEKLTDGKFNNIKYNASYWYLCKTDENGEVEDIDSKPCMHKCCVSNNSMLKSSYNSPTSDYIVYDEVISADGSTLVNEYVRFTDLLLTINRMRTTTEVFMLSNTLSSNSIYFREMLITDVIKKAKQGDKYEFYNVLGTFFTIDVLSKAEDKERLKAVQGYYCTQNSEVAGLVGNDVWSYKSFPHIPKEKFDIIECFYIETDYKPYRIDLVLTETGLKCYVHNTKLKEQYNNIVFTLNPIQRPNEIFGIGNPNKNIWKLRKMNRWCYADNEIGADIVFYLQNLKQKMTAMEI